MNHLVFQTGGDWNSTSLFNHGEEVLAVQLFIELRCGRDDFGDPADGGVELGGELTAIIRTQQNPGLAQTVLPARIEIVFPGHHVILENPHPRGDVEYTQLFYNGRNITQRVIDFYLDINAADDVVEGYVTLFKPHWLTADEVATYSFV